MAPEFFESLVKGYATQEVGGTCLCFLNSFFFHGAVVVVVTSVVNAALVPLAIKTIKLIDYKLYPNSGG